MRIKTVFILLCLFFLSFTQSQLLPLFGLLNAQTIPVCLNSVAMPSGLSSPNSLVARDFNMDGKMDLAVTNSGSNFVNIYLGNGAGAFAASVNYGTGYTPVGIASGDFNNDGKPDIATSNNFSDVSVLLGTGSGSFLSAVNYSVASNLRWMSTGYLNNDANLDLLVPCPNNSCVAVLMGSGAGTFAAPVFYNTAHYPVDAVAADFNSDGYNDIAVCNSGANNLSVLLGSSSGTFATAVNYNIGNSAYSIIADDFNGDGKLDLATGNVLSNNISVLLGSGTGTFSAAVNYPSSTHPYSVISVDMNLDGFKDLVTANRSSDNISILLGNGTGSFAPAVYYPTGGTWPQNVIAADFNGDGRPDLANTNITSNNVSVQLNLITPTLNISAVSQTACVGNTISLLVSGANTYTWSNGFGSSSSITPTLNSTSSYTAKGTAVNGCTNSAVQTISVVALPSISVISGSICSGSSFTIVPSGANTYTISGGSFVVSPNTNSSYLVNGTSSLGCISSQSATCSVTVHSLPVVTVNSGSICSGQSFTITPAGAANYSITGGSNIVSPSSHTNYSVSGTSTAGCVSAVSAIATVTVNSAPIITVNSGSICSGNPFTIIPSGANTYSIQGGSANVFPTSNTSYTIRGLSLEGCVSQNIATSNVTVNTTPTISVNSGSICSGNSFTIIPTGADSYSIQGGSTVVSPLNNTSYTVSGLSIEGCVSQNSVSSSVTVYTTPTVSVNSGSICSGDSFTIFPTGAITYSIQGGSAIVSPLNNTSYTVSGLSIDGCVSQNIATSDVSVHAIPIITVNNGTICSGESFTLVPTGATNYSYSGGSSIVSPNINSSYSITGTSAEGCLSTTPAISNVTVHALPIVSANSGTICNGQSFTLVATGANTYTYSSGSNVVSPTTNTSYSVSGTNSLGCISASPAITNVHVNALPILSIVAVNSIICMGEEIELIASGANTYTWSTLQTVNPITVSPTTTSNYSVNGTDVNGCINNSTFTLQVDECVGIGKPLVDTYTILVYPNPSSGRFNIQLKSGVNAVLIIYNSLGTKIMTELIRNSISKIDLSEKANGIYYLEINENGKIFRTKLIKN